MLKRVLCLLLAVIMLLALPSRTKVLGSAYFLFLVMTSDDSADKEDIFTFVCENEEALLMAVSEDNFSAFEHRGIIKDVRNYESVIDFSCGGAGVGSATSMIWLPFGVRHPSLISSYPPVTDFRGSKRMGITDIVPRRFADTSIITRPPFENKQSFGLFCLPMYAACRGGRERIAASLRSG